MDEDTTEDSPRALPREEAAEIVYVIFDLDGKPVAIGSDEDEVYGKADHDETVVTYKKA